MEIPITLILVALCVKSNALNTGTTESIDFDLDVTQADDTDAPENSIEVRLVDGPGESGGRVEVLYSGQWGTVCDDGWDDRDSAVVCRQLGYPEGGYSAYYGRGTGPIWLDEVACDGSERTLDQCTHQGWGQHNCGHTEDVGVNCLNNDTTIPNAVRLVGGSSEAIGRVEIFHRGVWGTVCDDMWDYREAMVVCRQLGFNGGEPYRRAHFGQGSGIIWLDDVQCTGAEPALDRCSHNGWGRHNCLHTEDAGVDCFSDTTNNTYAVRLVGGPSRAEGRVEIFYRGQWGTVCDDLWDQRDAAVVCRQMGYPGGQAYGRAYHGQGTGPIWMDNVQCNGSERALNHCTHNGWGIENCAHHEDAGVKCGPDTPQPETTRIPPPVTTRAADTPQPETTRVPPPVTTTTAGGFDCEDNNPCEDRSPSDPGYFPHRNQAFFIQCGPLPGSCCKMPCPPGLVWDVAVNTCNWP